MGSIEEFYQATKELHQVLQLTPKQDEREEYIKEINKLLDKREELMQALPQKYNPEEKRFIDEIFKLHPEINALLKKQQKEIEADLKEVRQKKNLHNKYTKQAIYGDGTFFDKRK